jgi:uncharacterized protein YcfL
MKKFLQIAGGILLVLLVIGYFSSNDKAENTTSTEVKEEVSTPEKPAIEILSQNFIDSDFTPRIVVEIKNNSNKTASYIQLKSVFYDSENKIIGTGIGNAADVYAGQTKTIDIITIDEISNAKQFKVELDNVMWE